MGAYPVANLKQIRENKYTRMKDFITKTGLSRKTIERAESGQYKISDNSIKEIADALGVEVDEIIDKERSYPEEEIMDNENTTKTLSKLGIKKYEYIPNIKKREKVRYIGASAPVYTEDGEVLNTLFFTNDMESPLYECEINICLPILESEFHKLVDKLFNSKKYRNAFDLDGFDKSKINENLMDILKNQKILSLRFGDVVKYMFILGTAFITRQCGGSSFS